MTIFGWDASDFDWDRGPMDLAAARRDGISFFTHKATEGTAVRHARYGEAMARAKAAGVPFLGAYHVVRSLDVGQQVAYLLAYANQATPWWKTFPGWFWQVDLELWDYDRVSGAIGVNFGGELARQTSRAVLLYASQGQYGNSLGGALPVWNANYGSNPAGHYRQVYPGDTGAGWGRYSNRTPVIWQYGSRTTIGSQGTCDANAFRGSETDFAKMIGADTVSDANDTLTKPYGPAKKSPVQMLADLDWALTVGSTSTSAWAAGQIRAMQATLAGQAATITALSAAVTKMATGGTSVDTAAVNAHIDEVSAKESAAVAALQAEVDKLRSAQAAGAQAEADALKQPSGS